MPDTEQIQPALTAEKWAEARYHAVAWGKHPNALWHFNSAVGEDPDAQVYLIALNNAALPNDDPHKIGRETVDALRRIAVDGGLRDVHDSVILDCIADQLAALLPPDESR